MHASLEQLMSLRDEEPVALEVQEHVRGCEECARVLNGLAAVQEGLARLADPLPPPEAWGQINAAAKEPSAPRRRWLADAGVALVASVAAAVVLVNPALRTAGTKDASTTVAGATAAADIGRLQAQSRYLERAVLDLNGNTESMPVSADTASTVAALEDRIALVDYEINSASTRKTGSPDLALLWKQRVDLLQSLAAVRYAQVADRGI
ncbi:MAG TPA: hypothetical protein VGT99_08710 [Gammaproteobacteria bacterium]|nr:hypothetical protein [Gammaproteobacteria bacterium]